MPPVECTGRLLEVMAVAAVGVAGADPGRAALLSGSRAWSGAGSPATFRAGLAVVGVARGDPAVLGARRRRAAARLLQRRGRFLRRPRRADRARVPGADRSDAAPAARSRSSTGRNSVGRVASSWPPGRPRRRSRPSPVGRRMRPIRIYVGLNSAETLDERAKLALDEMIRVGAFDRSVCSWSPSRPEPAGWTRRRWTRSSICTAATPRSSAVQYSYLTSWISLLVEPGLRHRDRRGRCSARSTSTGPTLPRDARPRLYLHGLSLGAYGSEQSVRLHEVIGDPYPGRACGAARRSPARPGARVTRRPQSGHARSGCRAYGDGSIVRFTNQENHLDIPGRAPGGRCGSSSCSMPATRSPSSAPTRSGASRTG